MALANLSLTNTFDEQRVRINQIIYKLDEAEGNLSNSLANVAAQMNYANTSFLLLTGGTVTGNVIFSTTGNVTFSGATAVINLL